MSTFRTRLEAASRLVWLALAVLSIQPPGLKAAVEQTFPLLQVGTQVYTNVTVTSKARNYVFIVHDGGMSNIKLTNLPPEVREKLGYRKEEPKPVTNTPTTWAKAEVAKLETSQMKEMRTNLEKRWRGDKSTGPELKDLLRSKLFFAAAGVTLLIYLFHCYCFLLICEKAGHRPGPLIWIPLLQLFPLLRAAGMSAWWFLVYFLPLLNLVGIILWSVNIAKARGKSGWVAFWLILPLTSFLALLYLAFSEGGEADLGGGKSNVMQL